MAGNRVQLYNFPEQTLKRIQFPSLEDNSRRVFFSASMLVPGRLDPADWFGGWGCKMEFFGDKSLGLRDCNMHASII